MCCTQIKAEFAVAFAKLLGADAKLMVFGDCADTLQSVKRPCDMTMSVCKFEEAFACELPSIQNELQLLARDYGASKS